MRIIISGTVGVGKSTVAKKLVKALRKQDKKVNFLNEETVNSIYLDLYYKSPQEWAFISQLDFLFERFKQWLNDEKERLNASPKKIITVYDRHFLDDYVFAELHTIKANISVFNSISYQVIYKEILEKMMLLDAVPDYLFMLKADLSVIKKRLESRGRKEEVNVDDSYWEDLYYNYYLRPMFKNHFKKNVKKLYLIDTNSKDSDQVVEEILKILEDSIKK